MERLHANEKARLDLLERRLKARLEQGDLLKDLVARFTSGFNRGKQGILRKLEGMKKLDQAELPAAFDLLVPEISALRVRLNEAVLFLPGFELRVAREGLQQLEAAIAKTRREVFRNSRFRFSAAAVAEIQRDDVDTLPRPTHVSTLQSLSTENGEESSRDMDKDEDTSIADQTGQVLQYGRGYRRGETTLVDYTLARLADCVVSLCVPASSMRIHRLHSCRVYVGPVAGSVHIEECEKCVFVLASKQVRMHTSHHCDLYLHIKSGPIIEHCSDVRFAPYIFTYEHLPDDLHQTGLDFPPKDSKWREVQDFRWLRAQQSPNWQILPEHERVASVEPVTSGAERDLDAARWQAALGVGAGPPEPGIDMAPPSSAPSKATPVVNYNIAQGSAENESESDDDDDGEM